jgi:hypothetical protein
MKKAVEKVTRTYTRLIKVFAVALIILIPTCIYTNIQVANSNSSYVDFNAIVNIITYATLAFIGSALFLYSKFKKDFTLSNEYLIDWAYENGDELIITKKGILNYLNSPQKIKVTNKFDGLVWNEENIQDVIESLIMGGISLGAFLPSIQYTETVNRVDNYIPLFKKDEVRFGFLETENQNFVMIHIHSKFDEQYTLNFPTPKQIVFTKNEFDFLISRLSKERHIDSFYVDNRIKIELSKPNLTTEQGDRQDPTAGNNMFVPGGGSVSS